MTAQEAHRRIGESVTAWTAMNGVYAGILVELTNIPIGKPWRGKILITGVYEPACPFDSTRSGRQRRGMRPGHTIEVGGCNIQPSRELSGTYREALQAELVKFQGFRENDHLRDARWVTRSIEELLARIEEEQNPSFCAVCGLRVLSPTGCGACAQEEAVAA